MSICTSQGVLYVLPLQRCYPTRPGKMMNSLGSAMAAGMVKFARQVLSNPKKLHGISNSHRHFPKRSCGHFFTERLEKSSHPQTAGIRLNFHPSCHAVQRWRPLPWPPGEKWWKIHGKWIVLDWWRLRGLPKNIEIFSIESIGDRESSTHFPENKVISKPVCFDHPFQMQLVWTGRCHVERDVAPISSALLPLVALDSSCKTWRL